MAISTDEQKNTNSVSKNNSLSSNEPQLTTTNSNSTFAAVMLLLNFENGELKASNKNPHLLDANINQLLY